MDLKIVNKQTGEEEFYIENCDQVAENDYEGSNIKVSGLKKKHWNFIWMIDSKTPALLFKDFYVASKDGVNNVIKHEIKKKYTIEDEIQILREKLLGMNNEAFAEYSDYIGGILNDGKKFKTNNFKKETQNEK